MGTSQIDKMHDHCTAELRKRVADMVGTFGYSFTCDGSPRYQRSVVNCLLTLPDGTDACIDLTVTGGERKSAAWWAERALEKIKGPLNPLPAESCILGNFDGGMLYAFEAIEAAFKNDPLTANLIASWCACHGHHLLIEDLNDLDGFVATFAEVNEVVKYFRNHDAPRWILHKFSPKKGYVRHCETRMASKSMVEERFKDLADDCLSTQAVSSPEWAALYGRLPASDRAACAAAKASVLDPGLLARVTKKLELLGFVRKQLRRADSDDPTLGVIYQM